MMTNKKGLGVKVGIGVAVVAAAIAVWNHFSSEKTPEKSADVTAPQKDSRGRTPEQKAVAIALAPVMISYRSYLETESSKLFPDETPTNATLLGKRLINHLLLESKDIERAFSQKDGRPYTVNTADIKNMGEKNKSYSVAITIDPAKGEISQTVDGKPRPAFKMDPQRAEKLRKATMPESAKHSFNTMPLPENLVTVRSLGQIAAPVEPKKLPESPAVRQITRRAGPMGLA